MRHDNGTLADAEVIVDRAGDPAFREELKAYLRCQLGAHIREVRLGDSRAVPLVQLASICGAVVSVVGRRVVYDGRTGDSHVE